MSTDTLQASVQNTSTHVDELTASEYAEALFESIKIVNESLMQDLHYDETIECTITDASNAAAGEYRVTNGSAEFAAYSLETYKEGTNVYVTIPQGDYSKDKIIAGKVAKADTVQPFKYVSPLGNFIDITGNLAPQENQNKICSLLANDTVSSGNGPEGCLYEPIFRRYDLQYDGFTRFAISADFASYLGEYSCKSGNYGLRCEVTIRDTNNLISKSGGAPAYYVKNFYLNVADMIGDPYNFEGFFRQEKLFDISELGAIESIAVYFEQEAGSFKDHADNLIPCYSYEWDGSGNTVGKVTLDKLSDNLYVQNVCIALGFDIRDYEGECVQLYSLNPLTYSTKVEDSVNEKTISLRWIHQDANGQRLQMTADNPDDFEIRWYRFSQGAAPADTYCGVNWVYVEGNEPPTRNFQASFRPSKSAATEQIKAIVLHGSPVEYYQYKICPFQNEDNFNDTYHKGYFLFDENATPQYVPISEEMAAAMAKDGSWKTAIYYYESQDLNVYRTPPLVFSNEEDIPDNATILSLSALTLECYDLKDADNVEYSQPTFGNYLLYNEQNDLIDKAQQNIARHIKWSLAVSGTVTSVTWHYPTDNTMLHNISIVGKTAVGTGDTATTVSDGLTYYIGNHYSSSKGNNTISCEVVCDGVTYAATKELTFGQAGTMGSSATFLLDFVDSQAVLTTDLEEDEEQDPLTVQAILYDENNRLVKLDSKYTISWSWLTSPKTRGSDTSDHIHLSSSSGDQITLTPDTDLSASDCYILQATLTGWNNTTSNTAYPLTAYLPIPIRRTSDYKYITGADRIVYLTDGSTSYYEGHYIMHKQQDSQMVEITTNWAIQTYYGYKDGVQQVEAGGHAPELVQRLNKTDSGSQIAVYKLTPAPFYFKNSTAAYAVVYRENNEVQWTQPIVILESRYFSSMVNDWDGKTLQLNDGEGAILASMIGAGKKTSDNQFSGVLLGDWSKDSQENTMPETGLYGFRNGQMTFGFKDNGTAFIGQSNRGQLLFDGNSSTITSAAYRSKTGGGMEIDFDHPKILMRQGALEDDYVYTKNATDYYEYDNAENLSAQIFAAAIRANKQLFIKNDDGTSYTSVTTWKSSWSTDKIMIYVYETREISYGSVSGITTKEDYEELCKRYGVSTSGMSTFIGNTLTKTTVPVADFTVETYPASTVWIHPRAVQQGSRTVKINATDTTTPLRIGDNFQVDWTGKVTAHDGTFSGMIYADGGELNGNLWLYGNLYAYSGQIIGANLTTNYLSADWGEIGGWQISSTAISGANTDTGRLILDSSQNLISGGTVSGSIVKGGMLTSWDASDIIKLNGYLDIMRPDIDESTGGKFGYCASGIPTEDTATPSWNGIGMTYNIDSSEGLGATATAEVKTTNKNAGLKYYKNYLSAEKGSIVINADHSYIEGSSTINSVLYLKAVGSVNIESGNLQINSNKFSTSITDAKNSAKTISSAILASSTLINSTLDVADTLTAHKAFNVTGTLTASGDAEVAGTLTVKNLKVDGGTVTGVYAVFG